jgi:hypothetical protein
MLNAYYLSQKSITNSIRICISCVYSDRRLINIIAIKNTAITNFGVLLWKRKCLSISKYHSLTYPPKFGDDVGIPGLWGSKFPALWKIILTYFSLHWTSVKAQRNLILDPSSHKQIALWFTSYDTLKTMEFTYNTVKFGVSKMCTEMRIDFYSPGAPPKQISERVKRTVSNLPGSV